MLSIGVAQTRNSTDASKNFESVFTFLNRFEKELANLVLFPECALSGCSAKMKSCTREFLSEFLSSIQSWVNVTGIHVVLPTAIVEAEKVYNSVFWFYPGSHQQFFKVGLTPSEEQFFSVPTKAPKKVIKIGDLKLSILICREAQDNPWDHFNSGDADAILWPGYWGWTEDDDWTEILSSGEFNSVMENVKSWRLPLIQSNFAFNDLEGYSGSGPIGRSVVVDSNNKLIHRGAMKSESGFIIDLQKTSSGSQIMRCRDLSTEQ